MALQLFKIETVEVASPVSAVTFSNIPQTYTDLKLVISARSETAQVYGGEYLFFNGATTNRSTRAIEANGSTVVSFSTSYMIVNSGVGASATTNTFGNSELYIPNYTSSDYKSSSIMGVGETNGTTCYMDMAANLWSSTAAITSITISQSSTALTGNNYVAGSTFTLYGVL